MLLYSPDITPRIRYVVDFINKELFVEPLRITSDVNAFLHSDTPGFNYSDTAFSDRDFFIKRVGLLFETGIRPQPVDCFETVNYKAFFKTEGDFPFDILAASFYLLSRYEEYLDHEKDEYGRYPHTQSLAFKEGFLNLPLINIWLEELKKALQDKIPSLFFHRSTFKFIPTYDIDIAYSYLHKGWKRSAGGLLKSMVTALKPGAQVSSTTVSSRIRVLLKKEKDPYDAYEWLDSLHLYCRVKAYYFFLVARQQRGYDKNIAPDKTPMKELIQYHSAGYTVGIHPSWQSGDDEKLLISEIGWLEGVVQNKIKYSRLHYIRFQLPETFRALIGAGIEKDFSMGYGSINGFRASIASSFYWYDLPKEEQTGLLLFPFCFMDANSFYEQKSSAQQALGELMHYYRAIRKLDGLMVTIWHNHILGTDRQFAGWKEAYEVFLKEEVYWDM